MCHTRLLKELRLRVILLNGTLFTLTGSGPRSPGSRDAFVLMWTGYFKRGSSWKEKKRGVDTCSDFPRRFYLHLAVNCIRCLLPKCSSSDNKKEILEWLFLSRLMGRLCSNYTVNFCVFSVDITNPLPGVNKDILCKPQRTVLSNRAKMKSICFYFKSVQLHRTSKEDTIHLTQTDKGESVLGK